MALSPDDYSALLTTRGLADLEEEVTRTVRLLEIDGTHAQAQLLRQAYVQLIKDLDEVAKEVASKAKDYILEEERRSRLRPNPTGDRGALLEDSLGESHPLPSVNGSVGINYEPVLYANVSWWWTQEEGYSGHVGRVVHGLFYAAGFTAAAAPSPGSFREHPLFRAEGPQRPDNSFGPGHDRGAARAGSKGERPGMRIENPIPERRFVREGARRAELEWHAKIARAKARFDRVVGRLAA